MNNDLNKLYDIVEDSNSTVNQRQFAAQEIKRLHAKEDLRIKKARKPNPLHDFVSHRGH